MMTHKQATLEAQDSPNGTRLTHAVASLIEVKSIGGKGRDSQSQRLSRSSYQRLFSQEYAIMKICDLLNGNYTEKWYNVN
jgi:hypothetical protein